MCSCLFLNVCCLQFVLLWNGVCEHTKCKCTVCVWSVCVHECRPDRVCLCVCVCVRAGGQYFLMIHQWKTQLTPSLPPNYFRRGD